MSLEGRRRRLGAKKPSLLLMIKIGVTSLVRASVSISGDTFVVGSPTSGAKGEVYVRNALSDDTDATTQ